MLAKKYRFSLKKEGKYLRSDGKTTYTPICKMIIRKKETGAPRFAFIVSKKTNKSAVKRNYIKRKINEAIHQLIKDISPVDALIIANKECETATVEQIKTVIKKNLNNKSK